VYRAGWTAIRVRRAVPLALPVRGVDCRRVRSGKAYAVAG